MVIRYDWPHAGKNTEHNQLKQYTQYTPLHCDWISSLDIALTVASFAKVYVSSFNTIYVSDFNNHRYINDQ